MMKITLLKTAPEGRVYSEFVNRLHEALLDLGHESTISDQSIYACNDLIPSHYLVEELVDSRPEAVLSFSSIFASATLDDGSSLFDVLGIKFVSWLLDHPVYAPQSLRREPKSRFAIYSNFNHERFAKSFDLPGRAMTMLPGGRPFAIDRDYHTREWPLFIAASWQGPPERYWEDAEESIIKRLLVGVIDRLLVDRQASLIDAFEDTCAELRIRIGLGQDPAADEQMRSLLAGALTYVRRVDRFNLMTAIADAGLPMTVCGSGWSERLGGHSNVTCIESVPFQSLPALYANSRVVLNLNAGNGGSERAIQAAFSGAAVVSDYSQELDVLFGGGKGVAFYDRAEPISAVKALADLLGKGGESIAQRGHERALAECGWRRCAERIVEFLAS